MLELIMTLREAAGSSAAVGLRSGMLAHWT